MGPYEAMTPCHQDGKGTVDSLHLVIIGYNEVVVLKRDMSVDEKKSVLSKFELDLYGDPHNTKQKSVKNRWPTNKQIGSWREKG